jgi:hypothetical protein
MAGVAMDNDDYAKAATLFEQAMDVNVKCATTYMFRAQVRTTALLMYYFYCYYYCYCYCSAVLTARVLVMQAAKRCSSRICVPV